jgi:small-conductance mechanosensitive channel
MRRRVKQAFDKADIEIPFPHVKVVRDREGAA